MARIHADNVVFLMRPGDAARRRAERMADRRQPASAEPSSAVRCPVAGTTTCMDAPQGYTHTLAPRTSVMGETPPPAETRRAPLRWVVLLAAACVVPMAVATWHAVAYQSALRHVATAVGEQRTLALPGGTARLDTDTALSVGAGTHPVVTLERGRAQFDAQPGAPAYVVHADGGVIAGAGGRYQVSRQGRAVHVVALAGTVSVSLPASDERATLQPGQQVDYGYGRLGHVQPADLAAARDWPRGELAFHHRSLAELVAAMNRYSDTHLVVGDPALRNLPVSGVFEAGNPQALAQALQRSRLLHAVQVAPDEIVLRAAAR